MNRLWATIKFIWKHPLAKNKRIVAYKNFFKWQLTQKIWPKPVIYPLVEDSVLMIEKGMTGATGNIYTGLLEFEDMAFVLHVLRPGDLFGDVGANIGVYTILASKNAAASVISIEPIPSTLEKIKQNVLLNNVSELVTILPYVVGSGNEKQSSVWFTQNLDTINHVVGFEELIDKKMMIEIPVKTLDELFAEKEPVIMKMDIEGFEWPALNGAKKILNSSYIKALVIELNGSGNRYGFSDDEIHKLLLSYNFKPFRYDPFSRQLLPLFRFGNMNTIYIKDVNWVNDRIKTAKEFRVLKQNV